MPENTLEEIIRFAAVHCHEDAYKLLLNASSYPEIDMERVAGHLEGRKRAKNKLPSWFSNEKIVYPSRLSVEQCSSELTARYKSRLLKGNSLTDMTGGLGVDCAEFANILPRIDYYERQARYCEAAENNFRALGLTNISVHNGDSLTFLQKIAADTIYIDPHRRGDHDERLYDIRDCVPNIVEIREMLLSRCSRLIVKLSPMADIAQIRKLLPECIEIHIVSVKNECKEVIAVLENGQNGPVRIFASEIESTGSICSLDFTMEEEAECTADIAADLGAYLYEPYSCIIKSGAFKSVSKRFGTPGLERNSHLYTSDVLKTEFPGRRFKILKSASFSVRELKRLYRELPKANISVRNFPLTVNEIRKISRIKDGGDRYLFATTLPHKKKIYILCEKI